MKHRPVVEQGAQPESPEKRDVLRELSELADELQRSGMARQAKSVRRAIKLIRTTSEPRAQAVGQAFVDRVTGADNDPNTIP